MPLGSENILTGKKYRVLKDKLLNEWDIVSFWTDAGDVDINFNRPDKDSRFIQETLQQAWDISWNDGEKDHPGSILTIHKVKGNIEDPIETGDDIIPLSLEAGKKLKKYVADAKDRLAKAINEEAKNATHGGYYPKGWKKIPEDGSATFEELENGVIELRKTSQELYKIKDVQVLDNGWIHIARDIGEYDPKYLDYALPSTNRFCDYRQGSLHTVLGYYDGFKDGSIDFTYSPGYGKISVDANGILTGENIPRSEAYTTAMNDGERKEYKYSWTKDLKEYPFYQNNGVATLTLDRDGTVKAFNSKGERIKKDTFANNSYNQGYSDGNYKHLDNVTLSNNGRLTVVRGNDSVWTKDFGNSYNAGYSANKSWELIKDFGTVIVSGSNVTIKKFGANDITLSGVRSKYSEYLLIYYDYDSSDPKRLWMHSISITDLGVNQSYILKEPDDSYKRNINFSIVAVLGGPSTDIKLSISEASGSGNDKNYHTLPAWLYGLKDCKINSPGAHVKDYTNNVTLG